MNNWAKIWEKRKVESVKSPADDCKELYMKMKVADGYDSMGELHIGFDDFYNEFCLLKDRISKNPSNGRQYTIQSVYEAGCGCGPELFLFEQEGIQGGGCDFS